MVSVLVLRAVTSPPEKEKCSVSRAWKLRAADPHLGHGFPGSPSMGVPQSLQKTLSAIVTAHRLRRCVLPCRFAIAARAHLPIDFLTYHARHEIARGVARGQYRRVAGIVCEAS